MRLLALLCGIVIALAQTPPPLTGTITGVIVDAITGMPIRKAIVTFRMKREDVRVVNTDSAGRFEALSLTPGQYRITAAARGYLPLSGESSLAPAHVSLSSAVAGKETGTPSNKDFFPCIIFMASQLRLTSSSSFTLVSP